MLPLNPTCSVNTTYSWARFSGTPSTTVTTLTSSITTTSSTRISPLPPKKKSKDSPMKFYLVYCLFPPALSKAPKTKILVWRSPNYKRVLASLFLRKKKLLTWFWEWTSTNSLLNRSTLFSTLPLMKSIFSIFPRRLNPSSNSSVKINLTTNTLSPLKKTSSTESSQAFLRFIRPLTLIISTDSSVSLLLLPVTPV